MDVNIAEKGTFQWRSALTIHIQRKRRQSLIWQNHYNVLNIPVSSANILELLLCRHYRENEFCLWNLNCNNHDDVIKWKHFSRYWPFVRGIHRSPVNSPHKGQWRGALVFSLICVWINGWVNNRETGDLRRYRAHYDVTVMRMCPRLPLYNAMNYAVSTPPVDYLRVTDKVIYGRATPCTCR